MISAKEEDRPISKWPYQILDNAYEFLKISQYSAEYLFAPRGLYLDIITDQDALETIEHYKLTQKVIWEVL